MNRRVVHTNGDKGTGDAEDSRMTGLIHPDSKKAKTYDCNLGLGHEKGHIVQVHGGKKHGPQQPAPRKTS